MMDINFDNYKVRCSSISLAIGESRSNPSLTAKQSEKMKKLEALEFRTFEEDEELAELIVKKENSANGVLSDSYIKLLCAEYSWLTAKKIAIDKDFMSLDAMEKGKIVEMESIATLSLVDGVMYTPNDEKERVCNEYLSGEVDAFLGETIMTADIIPDVKSIWDYPTFLAKTQEKLSLPNKFQVKGYIDITGAKSGFIADVLINTPPVVVERVKWKLLNRMGSATDESPEFKKSWEIIQRSMFFDDIPINQRVNKKPVEPFTEFEKNNVYDKVKQGREWLWKFHEAMTNLNK